MVEVVKDIKYNLVVRGKEYRLQIFLEGGNGLKKECLVVRDSRV